MLNIAITLCLILLNGFLVFSELAIVSSRRARLKSMAEAGKRGANRALALAADPVRFLSTVQIGISLVAIISGAYSATTLGEALVETLVEQGIQEGVARPLGFGFVILAVTYFSVLIGEVVPKSLALKNAEPFACAVAPFMTGLSRFAAPVAWLLDESTHAIFWLIGHKSQPSSTVTEEEIKTLIAEAETAGVLESDERQLISGVLRLGDRAVRALMTPRTDVDWIDLTADEASIRTRLVETPHSRLPAGEGSPDAMVGVVQTRELLAALLAGKPLDIRAHVRKAPIVPETTDALDVLTILRDADVPMALVHDEYGHFDGLVTPADVLESIAGVFQSDTHGEEPHAVRREDGSWLLSGAMPADEMAEQLGLQLPDNRDYQTVAGFVLAHLRHLPSTGETTEIMGWRFEIVDLDGRRIDKVLVAPTPRVRRRAAETFPLRE